MGKKSYSQKEIKDLILTELERSKEPVYPGSIAIKYGVPYLEVERTVKKMKEKGTLSE
jgi:hypothetical protein